MNDDSPQAQQECPACGELNCFDHALRTMEPAEAPELEPCPFCGIVPPAGSYYVNQGGKWGGIQCCIQGPEVRTCYEEWPKWKKAAISAWNTRAETSDYERGYAEGHRTATDFCLRIRAQDPRPTRGRCPQCKGGGFEGDDQQPCSFCGGDGWLPITPTPRATEGLTVEAALAELREMAEPDDDIEFRVSLDSDGHCCYWLDVNQAPLTNADSYRELVEKVRAWAKSRAERAGERT